MVDDRARTVKNASTVLQGVSIVAPVAMVTKDLFDANLTIVDGYYVAIGVVLFIFSLVFAGISSLIEETAASRKMLKALTKEVEELKKPAPEKETEEDVAKREEKPSLKLNHLKTHADETTAKPVLQEAQQSRVERTPEPKPIQMINPQPVMKKAGEQPVKRTIASQTMKPVRPIMSQAPAQHSQGQDDLSYFFKRSSGEDTPNVTPRYTVPVQEFEPDQEVNFDMSDVYPEQEIPPYKKPSQRVNTPNYGNVTPTTPYQAPKQQAYQSPDLNMTPFEKSVKNTESEDTSELIRKLAKKKKTNPMMRGWE